MEARQYHSEASPYQVYLAQATFEKKVDTLVERIEMAIACGYDVEKSKPLIINKLMEDVPADDSHVKFIADAYSDLYDVAHKYLKDVPTNITTLVRRELPKAKDDFESWAGMLDSEIAEFRRNFRAEVARIRKTNQAYLNDVSDMSEEEIKDPKNSHHLQQRESIYLEEHKGVNKFLMERFPEKVADISRSLREVKDISRVPDSHFDGIVMGMVLDDFDYKTEAEVVQRFITRRRDIHSSVKGRVSRRMADLYMKGGLKRRVARMYGLKKFRKNLELEERWAARAIARLRVYRQLRLRDVDRLMAIKEQGIADLLQATFDEYNSETHDTIDPVVNHYVRGSEAPSLPPDTGFEVQEPTPLPLGPPPVMAKHKGKKSSGNGAKTLAGHVDLDEEGRIDIRAGLSPEDLSTMSPADGSGRLNPGRYSGITDDSVLPPPPKERDPSEIPPAPQAMDTSDFPSLEPGSRSSGV